ncbi:cytochrome P450 2J4-like [Tubulanus polymorphus]|uniref:cytochrome P450 2J4-like n=1 Tax=Tubulanus polymorphus TaxID=672921 RepID=UPI003DA64767
MLVNLLEFIAGNQTIACVLLIVILWFITRYISKPLNLPPGPTGLPLLGNVFSIRKLANIHKNIRSFKSTCQTDIVHLRLFNRHLVIFYRYKLLRRAFLSGDFNSRPLTIANELFDNHGIISSSGELWKVHRRLALKVLRDFGLGKIVIENRIHEEFHYLENELINAVGTGGFDICSLLETSVSNIICSVCFGNRFEYGDETFDWLRSLINETMDQVSKMQILNFFPWLKYLPGDRFHYHRVKKSIADLKSYIQKRVDEHKEGFQVHHVNDFIAAYSAACKAEDETNVLFRERQLVQVILDLFIAGTETTTTTLRWTILAMVLKPAVQRKVQAEIDRNVPRSRSPTMADKARLPYTSAVLNEIQRYFYIFPIGIARANPVQVKLLDYDIPAQSIIMYSSINIMRDPNAWPNPDEFDPEGNFLDEKGNLLQRDNFIPFSIGKRSCLGESLAKMELFIFFASLLQKFTFGVDREKPTPNFTTEPRFITKPKPFTVSVQLRD